MWMIGGVVFGVIAALRRGSFLDRGIVGLSLIFYAFPTFFIGLLLYKFVAIKWELVARPEYVPIAEGGVGTWLQGLFLPGLTLALFFMAGYVRMTRAFVLESMSEDYVRTARAKGLHPRKVVVKHGLRAALTPLVTMAGLDFAGLMGGAIITETVFNYQGLGQLAVRAATGNDLPSTVGIVLLLASFVIAANIIVDLLYAVIDPRVRVG
jgi:peptide/nickel transport system permease protein